MLLVAGGTYDYSTVLDTTEVLLSLTASQWTFKAPLPNKLTELKGVTINNKILMTGTKTDTSRATVDYLYPYPIYPCTIRYYKLKQL